MTGRVDAEIIGSFTSSPSSAAVRTDRSRFAAIWLFLLAGAVLAMVIVGGATRLTGSGLSITEWKPISGVIPPLSTAAWEHLFRLYQATPQYRVLNPGMPLEAFKSIFWWEWAHRLLGRSVGLLFAVPFAALCLLKRLPRRLIGPCLVLFALGGIQGLAGWWMVMSGFENRVAVAPERLATHLGLALVLLCALIWSALEAWSGPPPPDGKPVGGWRLASGLFVCIVYVQCLLGALVAGNHAGLTNNDWPRMAEHWIPIDYWQGGIWATLAHGVAAVQFNHRVIAYGLLVFALGLAGVGVRSTRLDIGARALCAAAGALSLVQVMLGVATLVMIVPLPMAMLHQATAVVLLGLAAVLAWSVQRQSGTIIPLAESD